MARIFDGMKILGRATTAVKSTRAAVSALLERDWKMTIDILAEREVSIQNEINIAEGRIRVFALDAETGEGEVGEKARAELAKQRKALAGAQERMANVLAAKQQAEAKQAERDAEIERMDLDERRKKLKATMAQLHATAKQADAQIKQVADTLLKATELRDETMRLAKSRSVDTVLFDAWGALPPAVGHQLRQFGLKAPIFPDKVVDGWLPNIPKIEWVVDTALPKAAAED